ncbi:MAG: hypothetical protein HY350_05545, partial [Candidatus Omnitrophica bacterium]|nr:hypothetical protein [Candidatus Omnitrophota bacterium]
MSAETVQQRNPITFKIGELRKAILVRQRLIDIIQENKAKILQALFVTPAIQEALLSYRTAYTLEALDGAYQKARTALLLGAYKLEPAISAESLFLLSILDGEGVKTISQLIDDSQPDRQQGLGYLGNFAPQQIEEYTKGIAEGTIQLEPIQRFNRFKLGLDSRGKPVKFYKMNFAGRAPPGIFAILTEDGLKIILTEDNFIEDRLTGALPELSEEEKLQLVLPIIIFHEDAELDLIAKGIPLTKAHNEAFRLTKEKYGVKHPEIITALQANRKLKGLIVSMSLMDLGAEVIDGIRTYSNSLKKAIQLLPILDKKGVSCIYLYGGLYEISKISKELHQIPTSCRHFIPSRQIPTITAFGYDTKSAKRKDAAGREITFKHEHGNSFSIYDMRRLNPQLSDTDNVKEEFERFIRIAHSFGIEVIVDFIPWLAPDAINESNYKWTFYRELSTDDYWQAGIADIGHYRILSEEGKREFIQRLLVNNDSYAARRISEGGQERVVLVRHVPGYGGTPNVDEVLLNPFLPEVQEYYIDRLISLIDSSVDAVRVDLGHFLLRSQLKELDLSYLRSGNRERVDFNFGEEPWRVIIRQAQEYAREKRSNIEFITETYSEGQRGELFNCGFKASYYKELYKHYVENLEQGAPLGRLATAIWSAIQAKITGMLLLVYPSNFDEGPLKEIGKKIRGHLNGFRMLFITLAHLGVPVMVDLREWLDHEGHVIPIVDHPFSSEEEFAIRADFNKLKDAIEEAPWASLIKDFFTVVDTEEERYTDYVDNADCRRFISFSWQAEDGDWILFVFDTKPYWRGDIWVQVPGEAVRQAKAAGRDVTAYSAIDASKQAKLNIKDTGEWGWRIEGIRFVEGEEYKLIKLSGQPDKEIRFDPTPCYTGVSVEKTSQGQERVHLLAPLQGFISRRLFYLPCPVAKIYSKKIVLPSVSRCKDLFQKDCSIFRGWRGTIAPLQRDVAGGEQSLLCNGTWLAGNSRFFAAGYRSHRFPRIIKGQDFWKVFEEELRGIGITDAGQIRQIQEGGIYWINKITGEVSSQKENIIQAAARALSKVLLREVTIKELKGVIGYHEAIHAQLTKQDVVRIRGQLKALLTPAEYQTLLQDFQNQYGQYPDELELIEELIAQYKTETVALHNENLRLLTNDGLIIPLDRRVAKIISQGVMFKGAFSEDMLEALRGYYSAKRRLLVACREVDLETGIVTKEADTQAYEKALTEISAFALRVKQLVKQGESLAEAVENLRYSDEYRQGEIGEWNETLHAAGEEFSDEHKRVIRELAQEWAVLVAKPQYQAELEAKIISSVKEVSAEHLLHGRLTGMYSHIVAELLCTLGRLEGTEYSSTFIPKIRESVIFMLPFSGLILFRAVLAHEIFHFLCREGHIPSLHYVEVIPQAISASEIFKQGGKEALNRLYGELNSALFAAGQKLAGEEKSLRDVNRLLELSLNIAAGYYQQQGWLNENGAVNISQESLQRFVGVALAGWANQIEKDSGKPVMLSLLDFAKEVLTQSRGQAPLSPEDLKAIMAVAKEIGYLAHALSGDYFLKMAPWRKIWPSDQPVWRIVRQLKEFQFVPEDLAYLNSDAAKGLAIEELLRLLYFNPQVIEGDLSNNGLFLSLIQVIQTKRAINKGLERFPGISNWLSAFYYEQYEKASLLMSRIQYASMPYYLQFLEGALYEARLDKADARFIEKEVVEALDITRQARKNAVAVESDAEFYAIVKNEIWPKLQELYESSQDAAKSCKLFERAIEENRAPLSGQQQQMAAQGAVPSIKNLSQEQLEALQQILEDILEKMTPQEKDALAREIKQGLAEAE